MRVIPFPLLNTPQKPSLRGWNHWLGPFRGGFKWKGESGLLIYIYIDTYIIIYIYIYVCIPLTPYAITMFKWLNHGWNRVPFGKPVTNLTFIPQPLFCQAYCGDQGSWQGENLWISFGYPAHRYIYIYVCVCTFLYYNMVYIYIYVCAYIYICVCVHIYIYICVCVPIYI